MQNRWLDNSIDKSSKIRMLEASDFYLVGPYYYKMPKACKDA